jgi:hypothetical protein
MLQLLSSLHPGAFLQAACDSPEALLAYVQRNVRHDELILLLTNRFRTLKESCVENDDILFGADASMPSGLPKKFSLLREKTAEGFDGLVFKTEVGCAWAFSPVDALFSVAELLCSPESYSLGWLLLLQLPVVKIYHPAAYERIVRRIYAMLAQDRQLHAAALRTHINSECVFFPHHFSALRAFLTYNLEAYYPLFTADKGAKFVISASAEYIKTCWHTRDRFKPETCKDLSFSDLISSQLYCVVPSSYNIDLSLSAELNYLFYIDAATGVITRSLNNLDPKSLELLTTWAVRSGRDGESELGYDTSVSDLLYDSLIDKELKQRYIVIAQLVDYAVKSSLQRDVYFAAHIRYSLSGLFYVGSPASLRAETSLYKSLLGWADKPNNFPFAASLRSTVLSDFHKNAAKESTYDAAGYFYTFDSDDEYNSVMSRWLLVTDITALSSHDYSAVLPSLDLDRFFNRKVPTVSSLSHLVWPTCAKGSLGPLPQPYLTAPMTKRTTPIYLAAYTASLATSIGQYLQIVESLCFGEGGYTQGDLTYGQPVFMSRCLGAQLLSEVGVSATTLFHDTSEDAVLKLFMCVPRFLKYLAHDGHISPFAPGFHRIMQNRSLHTGPVTAKQFYSWYPQGATDQLSNYKTRLNVIEAVVFDRAYSPSEYLSSNTRIPATTPTAVKTVFTREYRNDVWSLGNYSVSSWGRCWSVRALHTICKREFSSRVGCKRLTFPLLVPQDTVSPSKFLTTYGASEPRAKRMRNSYMVADLHVVLPGGYEILVRVIRRGFQTFVSLPWFDLFTRYRVMPPHFTAVYHHKLSENKKRNLMDPHYRKEKHWGLYIDFCQRARDANAPLLRDLIKDWASPLDMEQAQLVKGVRVYQDVGFVFDLDFLINTKSDSWNGGVALCDRLPCMRQLIEDWRVTSFSNIKYEQRLQAKKAYNSSRRKTDHTRTAFTPDEDLAIINYYRKNMTERAEDHLRAVCASHDWLTIASRANKLAIKLVRDEGITEPSKLPVIRVGKSLHKLIEEVKAKQISGEMPC